MQCERCGGTGVQAAGLWDGRAYASAAGVCDHCGGTGSLGMRLRDASDVLRGLLRDLLEDYAHDGCGQAIHLGRSVCARCATPWPCAWERTRRVLRADLHHEHPDVEASG